MDNLWKKLEKICDILDLSVEKDGDAFRFTPEDELLEIALHQRVYRSAKKEYGMGNAKEVTAQIWTTLFDFPSLKTCTRFNRFILDCVDVVWDLAAGIDGRLPR